MYLLKGCIVIMKSDRFFMYLFYCKSLLYFFLYLAMYKTVIIIKSTVYRLLLLKLVYDPGAEWRLPKK